MHSYVRTYNRLPYEIPYIDIFRSTIDFFEIKLINLACWILLIIFLVLCNRIASQKDAASVLNAAWEESIKNNVAVGYMGGLIDALMWAGKLTDHEYEAAYGKYVYGSSEKNKHSKIKVKALPMFLLNEV